MSDAVKKSSEQGIGPTSRGKQELARALHTHRQRFDVPAGMSFERAGKLLNSIMGLLFPHFHGEDVQNLDDTQALVKQLDAIAEELTAMVRLIDPDLDAEAMVASTLDQFDSVGEACFEDASTLLENDPAANSLNEVIYSYPGFYAVAAYRIGHALLLAGIPLLPRLITEFAHQRTGIDIHPGARIGRRFFIDHGTGVVIGGTAVIGNNVKLYQGVTIGALRIEGASPQDKRHPTLEDGVVVYASATILGGETVVGRNSVIGGNVWLTRSVPPHSRVMFRACNTEEITTIEYRDKK